MTSYQNRRRWAIKQKEAARALYAVRARDNCGQWFADWCNMFFGSALVLGG